MDMFTPEMMEKIIGLMGQVSGDATTAIIIYFILPFFLLLIEILGWLFVVYCMYKVSIKGIEAFFNREFTTVVKPRVTKVSTSSVSDDFALVIDSAMPALVTLVESYAGEGISIDSTYLHDKSVQVLIADAKAGRDLRLTNKDKRKEAAEPNDY